MIDSWTQDALFPDWETVYDWKVREFVWPVEMSDWPTTEKERWGVLMAKRGLFAAMPAARVAHRGDAIVWDEGGLGGFFLQGDLDVAVEGRSPIFEVKTYGPAVKLRGSRAPAAQGLDWPLRLDYLNEQRRTGRPFYVLWVWPDADRRVAVIRGERVDLLDWPPHEESLNRRRNTKGAKMAYWYIDRLRPLSELAVDVLSWEGAPYQETLLAAL